MSINTPIENLAAAVAHAMYVGFPEIVYQDRDWEHYHHTKEDRRIEKRRRPQMGEITVEAMFAQVWGSTALGFGGLGGAAMTTAYTIVLGCEGRYAVYFGGRFAYLVQHSNMMLWADIAERQMVPVREAGKYEKDATDA